MEISSVRLGLSASYEILRVLGRRPATETFLAVDRRTGLKVVITAIEYRSLSADSGSRLRRELSLLARLRQSGFAAVLDVANGDDYLCLVRSYVEGVTLRHRLSAAGALGLGETLTVARDVLRGLAPLHDHGYVHRDVNPKSIILNERPPTWMATLVGFGLTSTAFLVPERFPTMCAPPRYMAPELAGLLDRRVDCRADLYSLGIVMFECLAGRPPFEGSDVRDVLRKQLSGVAPPLRSLGVSIPQVLEEIIQRLLLKDPNDRYQSAAAALSDIGQLDDALSSGVIEPGVAVGAQDCRESLTEPPLTGRERELSFLSLCLEDTRRGTTGGVVFLEAASGGGKTRVLDEFCQRAAAAGIRVFRGTGIERSARHPLTMFAGIVHDLLAYSAAEPDYALEVAVRIENVTGSLYDALPELRALFTSVQPPIEISEKLASVRLLGALASLLDALGSVQRPAVVVFDDCQWADELTLSLLESWASDARGEEGSIHHVLVVAAMRNDEVGPHRQLTSIRGTKSVILPPLDASQVGHVVESMAGVVPDRVKQVVAELSRGNPLMISAVLRGFVEDSTLRPSPEGWRFSPDTGGWQASREAAAVLAKRFSLLDPLTRRILDAGAVLGREFDLNLAGRLAECPDTDQVIQPAIDRNLVWPTTQGRFCFAHDKLRASLLSGLEPIELAELHRRAGDELERVDDRNAFEVAYHFDLAGESERAFGYAFESARDARARHDFEVAERQYLIAERCMETIPANVQYSVTEALGQILMLRGHYDEAAARFEHARLLAQDNLKVAWIECQLGELVFRRDDLAGAAAHMGAGLRALGEWIPERGRVRLLLRLLSESLRRISRGRARGHRTRRSTGAALDSDLMRTHLYTQLQYPRWFHSHRLETLWLMLRQVNVAERCPGTMELAHAYAVFGAALALTFPFLSRRAMPYVDHASEIYEIQGNLRGKGHAASMRACVLHAAGRYREAVASTDDAIRSFEQFGDRWELGFATRTRAVCLYRLGRLAEAEEEAGRLASIGIEVGDVNAQVTALEILAKTTEGRVPAVETQAALRRRGDDIEVTVAALQAEALRLRRAGRLREATASLEIAARMVSRAQPTSTHLVPVFAWLATCHREAAERTLVPHQRRRRLRRARASARRALRYAVIYPTDLPQALREYGLVQALSGNRRRARRFLERSAACAIAHDALVELAETNRQRARLSVAEGPPGEDDGTDPGAGVDGTELPTFGLVERFAALLEAGARLASTDSPEATVRAICDTAQSLLRAEHCRIVGFTAGWRPDLASMSADERAVVRRIQEHRRPVVLTHPIIVERDADDSGHASGPARSALCSPVYVREEMVGYFLALHTQVEGLFGKEEQQLAEFVTHLAGASLERQVLQRDFRVRVIAAQESERTRVARDLHDEIGQALTSVLLHARVVDGAVSGDGTGRINAEEVSRRVADLRQDVTLALDSVQRLAFDLRPALLDDLGLVAALRRLTASAITGAVDIELETINFQPGDRLARDIETTAYRVAQEAITNVARHAKASKCAVIIGRAQQRLRIVIEDNGIGFQANDASEGLGLLGMKERAALVGGSLRVSSTPGEGTEIVFEVHL